MSVADDGDLSILFMKFNLKGMTWWPYMVLHGLTDNFIYYSSGKYGDWLLIEFNHFFKNNSTFLKLIQYISTGQIKNNLLII